MTNRQENKLTMYNVVLKVLDKYGPQVASIVAFALAKGNFALAVQLIRKANLVQEKTTKGKTLDKQAMKEALSDEAYTVATAVQAYAATINDNDLYELVHYSRSTLLGMEDERLPQICQLILTAANDHAAALVDFGVDAVQLAELDASIQNWGNESTEPRMAISERVAATGGLPGLFGAADEILKKQLDKLMEKFRKSDPVFYNTYKSARKIVNAGHGQITATVKGKVVDAATQLGIAGATVEDTDMEVVVVTDANGFFEMKKVSLGETEFTVMAEGFVPVSLTVYVKLDMEPLGVGMVAN
jgi:hypothetical protein